VEVPLAGTSCGRVIGRARADCRLDGNREPTDRRRLAGQRNKAGFYRAVSLTARCEPPDSSRRNRQSPP
jgi:hypothetical protein